MRCERQIFLDFLPLPSMSHFDTVRRPVFYERPEIGLTFL